jgi:hypothetical protein
MGAVFLLELKTDWMEILFLTAGLCGGLLKAKVSHPLSIF